MKTFEERYTAWVDGRLEGSALTAFEQELARRSAVAEAEVDRADTDRLRRLLRDHLEAPALSNPEFFSHQVRERINAEKAAGARKGDGITRVGGLFGLIPWSFARLAGAGAACLFVAAALYYGLEPGPVQTGGTKVANRDAVTQPSVAPSSVTNADVVPPVAVPVPGRSESPLFANRSPTPPPLFDTAPDIKVQSTSGASATGLHYQRPDVNVLWTNGLPYLPDVPTPTAPSPAPAASVAP